MVSEAHVLKLVASRLREASIPYMVSGSMALNFYATPRMTRDIDIVVEIQPDGIEGLVRAFQADFYVDDGMILHAIQHLLPFNIIHLSSITKVDLIPRNQTAFQHSSFQRMKFLSFEGDKIAVISPEDLIVSKLIWSKDSLSEFQLRDVDTLLAYVTQWVSQLGLEEVFSKAKK
jgi:hypothetical protein